MTFESFHVRRDLSPRSMYAPLRVPIKTDIGPFEMPPAFMCPQLVVDVVVLSTVAAVYDRPFFLISGKAGAHRAPLQLYLVNLFTPSKSPPSFKPFDGARIFRHTLFGIVAEVLPGFC